MKEKENKTIELGFFYEFSIEMVLRLDVQSFVPHRHRKSCNQTLDLEFFHFLAWIDRRLDSWQKLDFKERVGLIVLDKGPVRIQPKTVCWDSNEPQTFCITPGSIVVGKKSAPINRSIVELLRNCGSASFIGGRLENKKRSSVLNGRFPDNCGTTKAVMDNCILRSVGEFSTNEHCI
ncbi:hypothetical protein FF38_06281 [Lucilia cuprina]|uniref:Uncharacterized protein n=1 Tax=Lucilia cuprina TaxID=7375 RepID=A0A0L0CF25_LUCCU|nr:hypothetical protein FF38_06281 [Lucilia cuprina]